MSWCGHCGQHTSECDCPPIAGREPDTGSE